MLGSHLPNNTAEVGDARFITTCKFLEKVYSRADHAHCALPTDRNRHSGEAKSLVENASCACSHNNTCLYVCVSACTCVCVRARARVCVYLCVQS